MPVLEERIHLSISSSVASKIGKAIGDFKMIGSGDRINVGLSGGKDSILLLVALSWLKRRSPVKFSLEASMIDITGGKANPENMERLCESLDTPFRVIPSSILEIIAMRQERSPCSFCSNMRAGALFGHARDAGSTTVAMGHNLDDAVETVLLNLFHAGKFRCFTPRSWRSRTGLWLIRPLVFLTESEIGNEVERLGILPMPPMCPFPKASRRNRMKEILGELEREIPDIRSQVLHALMNVRTGETWSSRSVDQGGHCQ